MLRLSLIALLISNAANAVISPADFAIVQTAANTFQSLRTLNEIITESREFSENFERVYAKVDNAIWKADRIVMWMEDIKALKDIDIKNIDDFNYVLAKLKNEAQYLRKKVLEIHNDQIKNNNQKTGLISDKKRILERAKKYRSETKGSMSPSVAQVETAKNTKDLLVENAKTNASLKDLNIQIATLLKYNQKKEQEEIAKKLSNKEKMRTKKKGVLTRGDLK